jgi:hypothetical protein
MVNSRTVKIMARLLSQVEEAGMKKYGKVDFERFIADGRDDNLASVIRHQAAATKGPAFDKESGQHHLIHSAFRDLMQVMVDMGYDKE